MWNIAWKEENNWNWSGGNSTPKDAWNEICGDRYEADTEDGDAVLDIFIK